ncbi:hypothetical protein Bca101_023333 [Brassica carinata]
MSAAEAGVFWDINQCEIPDLSAAEATQNMRHTLFNKGHRGTVKIKAYGDKKYYDFLSAGVDINHFTSDILNVSEEIYERHTKMFEDVVSWAAENPEPSTLVLILGDTEVDFHGLVERLKRERKYRFIYVEPSRPLWADAVIYF